MAIYSWFTHEKLWFSITMLVYQRVPKPCKSHRTASSVKTPVLSLRNASQCAVWMDLNWTEAKKLPQAFRQGLINGIWLPVLQPACWRSGAETQSKENKGLEFHMATQVPKASCFCRTYLQISNLKHFDMSCKVKTPTWEMLPSQRHELNWVGLRLQDLLASRSPMQQKTGGIKDFGFPKFTHPHLILGKVRHASKPQVSQLQLLQCYDACVPSH